MADAFQAATWHKRMGGGVERLGDVKKVEVLNRSTTVLDKI